MRCNLLITLETTKPRQLSRLYLNVAGVERFELPTFGFGIRRSAIGTTPLQTTQIIPKLISK